MKSSPPSRHTRVRAIARRVRTAERLATASWRALPAFLVIGAQKSGTTSMYNFLVEHPEVRRPITKEVHFFDVHYSRGDRWYRSHFPLRIGANEWITGEATPAYLFHSRAPERAAGCLPEARFLVLLRNPIDRAYSHYQHEKAKGAESLSFQEALRAEPVRTESELERQAAEPDYFSYNLRHFAYLRRGFYAEQLQRWFEFYPRDRFLVLQSEELFSNPETTLRRVFAFLELSDHDSAPFPTLNERLYSPMDPEVRKELIRYYREPNESLFQLLGMSFEWN